MDFFLQGELLHFSVVYLYSRSQDLSILTMALGLSETVSGSTVFLPTDFGRRTIANITGDAGKFIQFEVSSEIQKSAGL